MESRNSLVNFLGKDTYVPITPIRPDKVLSILNFIKQVDDRSLRTIFKVGFAEIKRRIINSSRSIYIIHTIESDINHYIGVLHGDKCATEDLTDTKHSKYFNLDYKLYILFIYIYFIGITYECNDTISRQQVLDMMLAYSTNAEHIPMLEFIFIALVSERQIHDGCTELKCSQYEDLNKIIKCFAHTKDLEISKFQESNMDKPYIDSYMDAYSEALEYKSELENQYKYSILDIRNTL